MNAATSSFVVSWSTVVVVPAATGIFTCMVGIAGSTGVPGITGPDAGCRTGIRTSIARMPMMHPRIMRTASFLVSRENTFSSGIE
jgi:hypothetical protein